MSLMRVDYCAYNNKNNLNFFFVKCVKFVSRKLERRRLEGESVLYNGYFPPAYISVFIITMKLLWAWIINKISSLFVNLREQDIMKNGIPSPKLLSFSTKSAREAHFSHFRSRSFAQSNTQVKLYRHDSDNFRAVI